MKRKLMGVAAMLALIVATSVSSAAPNTDDEANYDNVSDVVTTGGVLLAQVSTPTGKPPATPTKATPKPKASTVDKLRATYAELKKAWIANQAETAELKKSWAAWRDKNDGQSNSRDLLTLLIALLGTTATLGKTALRFWHKRTDE